MSLFLITGSAGTGKSQVCCALKERGYEAYDTDDDGLARWQHIASGYIYPKSSVKPEQRTAAFIDEHAWIVPREYFKDLLQKSEHRHRPLFVCGSLGNEDAVRDLFRTILALYVDDDTLRQRLTTRTTNDWGKQPHELEQTLQHHHIIYEQHKHHGDTIIDATQPLDEVVDAILRNVIS
ncbi:MAG TPA: AAA family ATPase [Candidatus Saccharimonadales bacterium]|nr:AAA family ATPase [Candidatus Saccharimonadales bacterium]